jgi:hypothetical protein
MFKTYKINKNEEDDEDKVEKIIDKSYFKI